jgi:hypothetical protein
MDEPKPTLKRPHRNTARTNKMRTKLVQGIAQGMNVSEAGRQAGYSYPQAAHLALKGIRLQMQDILERMDLPIEKVLRAVLVPGLEAERIEFITFMGAVMETKRVVDHEQRGKYFDRYCKLLGLFANGHDEVGPSRTTPTFVINLGFLGQETAEQVLTRARERARLGNSGQPVLDATPDQDQGRTGPDKPI